MKLRKWVSTLLAVCMLLPTVVTAADVETEPEIVQQSMVCIENPMGALMPDSPVVISDATTEPDSSEIYSTVTDAANVVLTGIKARESSITINVSVELFEELGGSADDAAVKALYNAAFAHNTNDPAGGDYAKFTMDRTTAGWGQAEQGDEILYYIISYYPVYRTTLEQENAVDAKVAEFVNRWKDSELTEFQTIQLIYDYITANVSYDHEGLNDDTDLTKYTAYGAICENSAVCMGISILFYRLALEMGIDARFINSIKSENHAWNIVKLGNYYYNLDATWDLDEKNTNGYRWFLQNMDEFQVNYNGSACHTRTDELLTDAFMEAHPMADSSYGLDSNLIELDRGNIAFTIPHIGVDTTNWTPDCLWEEGEYAEIYVPRTWVSVAVADGANANLAKNLPMRLGMSWDDEYIYTYVQFTDPNGHDNTWESDPGSMWQAGCMQVGYAEADATDENRLEYGIGRTSDTNELLSNVWAMGRNYDNSTVDYNVRVGANDTMVYEFRTRIDSFSTVPAAAGVTYGACYVLSWGNGQDFAHTQLGSGISGDAGKAAENFMKVTLSEEVLTELPWNTWENLEWKYDTNAETLRIRGEGAIRALESNETYPWNEYENIAEHVVIEEGITVIPSRFTYHSNRMQTLALPSTLTNVDISYAFGLQSITVTPGGKYYSEDGVLFSNVDGYRSLVRYPTAKTGTYYAVPDDVQCIKNNAFLGYGYLQEIYISKSVELVLDMSFNADAITTITVDAENAYYKSVDGVLYNKDMTLLQMYPGGRPGTTFTVPDTVTEMTFTIFTKTRNLQVINIPASVETIWDVRSMNGGCKIEAINVAADNPNYCSVDGVLYSKDMTTLYYYPMGKTDTVYTMPDTVTTLGWSALWGADKIETLYIGKNVINVEHACLNYSPNLTAVYFPGDLPDWFADAFGYWQYNNNNVLTRVTLYYPTGASGWTTPTMEVNGVTYNTAPYTPVEDIPWNTWNNVQWKYDETTKTLTIAGDGAIPEYNSSDPYPWESVMRNATTLVFEEGVTSVPSRAFSGMYNLTTLSIPASMQYIQTGNPSLFANARSLSTITAAAGGTYSVQDGVLFTADTLVFYPSTKTDTTYTIPEGIKNIGAYAFQFTQNLTALTLPESLKTIGDNALTLLKLQTLHIPKNVSGIHKYAFPFTNALTAFTVDSANTAYTAVDGILYTKDMTKLVAYPDNHPATTFTVPNTVVEMTSSMLHTSRNLKILNLPASVTTLWGARSTSGSVVLEAITVDADNPSYCAVDGVLYSKDMTILYKYPNHKADKVFRIPDSVTRVDSSAMYSMTYLQTLYFGTGVTSVGSGQFVSPQLTSFYLPGDLPNWFNSAFNHFRYYNNLLDTITFYYPEGAAGWSTPTTTVNGVTYKTAPYTRTTAEDLTGDGSVGADDAVLLTDYFSGKTVDFDPTKADFDHDGAFTRADAMYLARALAGWAGYTIE